MSIFSEKALSKLDKRKHDLIVSLDFSMNQAEIRYNIAASKLLNEMGTSQSDCVGFAWDFIDWCERIRKLLGHGAGLKKQEEWYKDFANMLSQVEDARHIVQHIDGSINQFLSYNRPPLGQLTAILSNTNEVLMIGKPAGQAYINKNTPMNIDMGDIPEDLEDIEAPIDHVCLHVGDQKVSLTKINKSIKEARANLHDFIARYYD